MEKPRIRFTTLALCGLALASCKGEEGDPPARPRGDERTLVTLQSYVFATQDEASFKVAERIRNQIKSAFGGLKALRVVASNKEIANSLEDKLYKEAVILVRPGEPDAIVSRVWFRFTDEVFAPAAAPRDEPILVGGIHRQDDAQLAQIMADCTDGTGRERDLRGSAQNAFDGSRPACQEAILAEQARIDAARSQLGAPDEEVIPAELGRTYVPVVARLVAVKPSQMERYPRFEDVVPQSGRARERAEAASARAPASSSLRSDVGPPARLDDRPEVAIVTPITDGPAGRRSAPPDEEPDPDAPPEIAVPNQGAVAAAPAARGPQPVQPHDGGTSFSWEDLGDKRFWVMWLALLGLYPLLKRRAG